MVGLLHRSSLDYILIQAYRHDPTTCYMLKIYCREQQIFGQLSKLIVVIQSLNRAKA